MPYLKKTVFFKHLFFFSQRKKTRFEKKFSDFCHHTGHPTSLLCLLQDKTIGRNNMERLPVKKKINNLDQYLDPLPNPPYTL